MIGGREGGHSPIQPIETTLTKVDEEIDVVQQFLAELGWG